MTVRAIHPGGVIGRCSVGLACACLLAGIAVSDTWALPESISGSIQVNAVDGETGDDHRSSLNQRYSLHWSRRLLPYLTLRTSLSYDRFGTETAATGNVWREQIQPTAELGWNTPYFSANGTYRHLESNSRIQTTSLVRNSLGLSLRTRMQEYPILSLRYDDDETYNKENRADRDTREQRYQLGLSHHIRSHSLFYNFTHRDSDIRSGGADISESQHRFRWDQTTRLLNQRLRLTTGYNFSYRRQVTTAAGDATVFRTLPLVTALRGRDGSPDFGSLDSNRTLADGNIEDPAHPEIDIGEEAADINLGVDLGFAQTVGGLLIYTDRVSGVGVTWTIYTSEDNLTWERLAELPDVEFSTSFSRYEILFTPVNARYVKAVAGGINTVPVVLVTEIEALAGTVTSGEEEREQSSHQANAALGYRFSDKVQSNVDLYYRAEPSGDFATSRDQLFYGISTRYAPWETFTHTVSYQAGEEQFSGGGEDLSTATVTYTAMARPLETLDMTFSASNRRTLINDDTQQETNSALFRSSGDIFRKLTLTADVGFSRTKQPMNNRRFDTWTYQASTDAGLLRSLDATMTYLYQRTQMEQANGLRERHLLTANLNWRLTRSILLRGTVSRNRDEGRDHISQEYSAVWRLSRKMTISGVGSLVEGTGGTESRRTNLLFNYSLSARTSLSLTYIETDSSGESADTKSFQVGLRTGF